MKNYLDFEKEIKTLGTHIVKIDLHSEIQAEIKIKVNSLEQTK
jgi:ribosomal protein L9